MADLLLPLTDFDGYAGTAEEKRGQKAIDTIFDLQNELHKISSGAIPRTLREVNVPGDILKETARKAAGDGSRGLDADVCLTILEQAWEGK
jgi:hypothetical protein